MKIYGLGFFFSLLTCFSIAQTLQDSVPIYEYPFSKEIYEGLSSGEMRISKAAQYFSYIGQYQKALSVPNEVPLEWDFDTLTQDDIDYLTEFKSINAAQAIIEQAEKEQIIMVNEAHHKPLHRVFTRSLLKGLYDQGFRYFGLEAISNPDAAPPQFRDTLFRERGYPLNSPVSGSYVTEPQMANLIREAHQLGYTLFGYDKFSKTREIDQASYISKILEKDPEAKILIHCGWYHLLEKENRGKTWMAYHLNKMTGINPFTIYLDLLVERNCTQESPLYQMMDFKEPTIFRNEQGNYYKGKRGLRLFDALVYFPRTKYINNRPDWLVKSNSNKMYKVDNISILYPCIVKAYKNDESNRAVPIDIIELEFAMDRTVLVLPKGSYRLVITNPKGERQQEYISID